jgi:hypothetical protein
MMGVIASEAISSPTDEIATACKAGLAMTSTQIKRYKALDALFRLIQQLYENILQFSLHLATSKKIKSSPEKHEQANAGTEIEAAYKT